MPEMGLRGCASHRRGGGEGVRGGGVTAGGGMGAALVSLNSVHGHVGWVGLHCCAVRRVWALFVVEVFGFGRVQCSSC
jgi:hypothetical protein